MSTNLELSGGVAPNKKPTDTLLGGLSAITLWLLCRPLRVDSWGPPGKSRKLPLSLLGLLRGLGPFTSERPLETLGTLPRVDLKLPDSEKLLPDLRTLTEALPSRIEVIPTLDVFVLLCSSYIFSINNSLIN